MRWGAFLFGLLLAGCLPKSRDYGFWLEKLESNPRDFEAMAHLALAGRPMVKDLIRLLERDQTNNADLEAAVPAILTVAGEPCAKPMAEVLATTSDPYIRRTLLDVFARGKWRKQVRRLTDLLADPDVGPNVAGVVASIMAPDPVPENPWADGSLDEARKAEWGRWIGKKAPAIVALDLRESLYEEEDLAELKRKLEAEFDYWR